MKKNQNQIDQLGQQLVHSDKIEEKVLVGKQKGMVVLTAYFVLLVVAVLAFIWGINHNVGLVIALAAIYIVFGWILLFGLKVLKPQEALALTLFGHYYGTLKGAGFYYVNPFAQAFNPAAQTKLGQSGDVSEQTSGASQDKEAISLNLNRQDKKISMKVMTLNNSKQKINDYLGNPVEIGVAVIWKVNDTAKAVFNVDNFKEYLSLQTDTALRNIIRQYPYDVNPRVPIDTSGDGEPDDGSLRGSSEIVAQRIKDEIQDRVEFAGLEILEARITHLSYAPEIAAAMLQRQQASALIDARAMIVDGAVGMVDMALAKLEEESVVELDEERKAAMVSNLLVVLCGNNDVSPIVNSGSLY